MKKIYFFGVMVLGVLIIILLKRRWCQEIECFVIRKLNGYNKIEVYQDTNRAYLALFKKNLNQLRVEAWINIENLDANIIIKEQKIRMHTLYEKAVSPYPSEITNTISCAEKYQPKYSTDTPEGRETHNFVGFSTERLAFGSCTDDLIAYRASVTLFYCKEQKKLFKFELFSPIGDPMEKFNSESEIIKKMPCQ